MKKKPCSINGSVDRYSASVLVDGHRTGLHVCTFTVDVLVIILAIVMLRTSFVYMHNIMYVYSEISHESKKC